MTFTIRRGTVADAPTLAAFAAHTFAETFAADNRPEDMALHAASAYGAEQQGRELADPMVRIWLAFHGPTLAAYAQLRLGQAPAVVIGRTPVELWRFYVARDWHGHGLAQTMMQHVFEDAERVGADTLWLGVWERNPRAIRFYAKLGYTDVGSHAFALGHDVQTDRLMVRDMLREAPEEIRIVRRYPAPLAQLWAAWADERQIREWWGPRGFTITTHHKDLRQGGTWDYTMHGPDGKDWPNFTRYHEVIPETRLRYDHGATSADAAPMFRVRADFRRVGDESELDMRMTLPSAEAAAQTRVFVKAAGGNGTWDRLAEFLERQATSREVCVVVHHVAAPRDVVARHALFADAHAVTARYEGSAAWLSEYATRVAVTASGPHASRITVRVEPVHTVAPAEAAAFVSARDELARLWAAALDHAMPTGSG